MADKVYKRDFDNEFEFTASKSSGPGGQNVNKVNSKVTLRFSIDDTDQLDEKEKERLRKKIGNKINNEGELVISDDSSRSQLKNKEETIRKFYNLLEKAFKPRKKRIPTKKPKKAKEKRLKEKKIQAEKKQQRQKLF